MAKPKAKVLKVDLSGAVRARLATDASEQGASINDVATGILADHFHVPFEGTGRRSPGAHKTEDGQVLLRVPPTLWRKVHVAAVDRSKREVVEAVLRSHYQLDADAVAA